MRSVRSCDFIFKWSKGLQQLPSWGVINRHRPPRHRRPSENRWPSTFDSLTRSCSDRTHLNPNFIELYRLSRERVGVGIEVEKARLLRRWVARSELERWASESAMGIEKSSILKRPKERQMRSNSPSVLLISLFWFRGRRSP